MPYKINQKPKASLYDFSNKNKIIAKNANNDAPSINPVIGYTGPFLDRLTLTVKPQAETGWAMKSSHFTAMEDAEALAPAKTSGHYKRAFRLKLESVADFNKWPFYEFSYDENSITAIRLDFVPVDLGLDGLADLHSILVTLVPDGWQYFIKYGRITRIDIAVDFPNVDMGDFYPSPASCMTTSTWTNEGNLETIVFGRPKTNQTRIYSRKKKRLAQGKGWQKITGIRIERKLINPNMKLIELPQLDNPFQNHMMYVEPKPKPEGVTQGKWTQFMCAVKVMGMASALGTVSPATRKKYRDHLEGYTAEWWSPDTIWAGWQQYLSDAKICDIHAWN